MNFSKIILKKEIQNSLHYLINLIKKKDRDLLTLRGVNDTVYTTSKIYSFLKELYASTTGVDAMLSGILLEHVHECEKIVAGSGQTFIRVLLQRLEGTDSANCNSLEYHQKSRDLCASDIDSILDEANST